MSVKINALQALPIFRNISIEGLQTMMDCFSGEFITVKQGKPLKTEETRTYCLINGAVAGLKKGHLSPMPTKENTHFATEDSKILILESHMLLYPCYGCCFFHAQLLQNMREDGIDFKALENV